MALAPQGGRRQHLQAKNFALELDHCDALFRREPPEHIHFANL